MRTHRWIGLSTAIVLTIAGLTGAALVWDGPFPLRGAARRLHDSLALGPAGGWIVWTATVAAIPLQLGGLVLWWRRKALRIDIRKGWRRALFDLHHALGAIAFVLMLVITTSAIGHSAFRSAGSAEWRNFAGSLHTGHRFPLAARLAYSLASLTFVVQSVSGLSMWWKPSPRATGDRRPHE